MMEQKEFGYYQVLGEYRKTPKEAEKIVQTVCRALECLNSQKGIRLAVLGSEVTRNPHEFDRDTISGKLLIQALSCINGGLQGKAAEDILLLYYASGIKPDDISSFTTVYGIHLYTGEGEHPAYQGFLTRGEPCVVTLYNLGKVVRADAKQKTVYVVENQMVFSHLCERLNGKETALICTSGQVKTASLLLLDLLWEAGCQVFYSGDFDPEGLSIAEKILIRNPARSHPWHMANEDYEASMSDQEISRERLCQLEKISLTCLTEAKDAILSRKKAGYQERLLEKLWADLSSQ